MWLGERKESSSKCIKHPYDNGSLEFFNLLTFEASAPFQHESALDHRRDIIEYADSTCASVYIIMTYIDGVEILNNLIG